MMLKNTRWIKVRGIFDKLKFYLSSSIKVLYMKDGIYEQRIDKSLKNGKES